MIDIRELVFWRNKSGSESIVSNADYLNAGYRIS